MIHFVQQRLQNEPMVLGHVVVVFKRIYIINATYLNIHSVLFLYYITNKQHTLLSPFIYLELIFGTRCFPIFSFFFLYLKIPETVYNHSTERLSLLYCGCSCVCTLEDECFLLFYTTRQYNIYHNLFIKILSFDRENNKTTVVLIHLFPTI